MRILLVIQDQRSAEPVTVLSVDMAVVPEGAYHLPVRVKLTHTKAYMHLPAWSGTLNSYRKSCSAAIGHCVTQAGPSAQFVLC